MNKESLDRVFKLPEGKASPTLILMSRRPLLLVTAAILFGADVAFAQDRPISVYFEPCDTQQLNDAIAAALTQPPFLLQTRNMPGALVVSIPDRITVDRKTSGIVWTFTVAFRRNGDSLGQSVESCEEKNLNDCTDQIVSDVKSAAETGQ
jgi:hypothetical protein